MTPCGIRVGLLRSGSLFGGSEGTTLPRDIRDPGILKATPVDYSSNEPTLENHIGGSGQDIKNTK